MPKLSALFVAPVISLALIITGLTPYSAYAREGEAKVKLLPGDIPPTKLGTTRGGDDIETTQFTGRVLIVTFWASWCAPCRAEMGVLEGMQQLAKDKLKVVAVNIEPYATFREVNRALKNLEITITNDQYKNAAKLYGVGGIPHMVIIGKNGKVIKVHTGYGESALQGLVEEINAAIAAT